MAMENGKTGRPSPALLVVLVAFGVLALGLVFIPYSRLDSIAHQAGHAGELTGERVRRLKTVAGVLAACHVLAVAFVAAAYRRHPPRPAGDTDRGPLVSPPQASLGSAERPDDRAGALHGWCVAFVI